MVRVAPRFDRSLIGRTVATHNEYTPREAAYDIALAALNAAFRGHTGDVSHYAETEGRERAVKAAIAKLHDRLLMQSGLNGLGLS